MAGKIERVIRVGIDFGNTIGELDQPESAEQRTRWTPFRTLLPSLARRMCSTCLARVGPSMLWRIREWLKTRDFYDRMRFLARERAHRSRVRREGRTGSEAGNLHLLRRPRQGRQEFATVARDRPHLFDARGSPRDPIFAPPPPIQDRHNQGMEQDNEVFSADSKRRKT